MYLGPRYIFLKKSQSSYSNSRFKLFEVVGPEGHERLLIRLGHSQFLSQVPKIRQFQIIVRARLNSFFCSKSAMADGGYKSKLMSMSPLSSSRSTILGDPE
jgi:hypothetical protein